MLIRLLSLVPCVAALGNRIRDLETEKAILQSQVEAACADRDWMRDQTGLALEREREALRMAEEAYKSQTNWAMQQRFGVAPHPEASQLPPEAVPRRQEAAVSVPRYTGGQAVRAQTQRFMEEVTARAEKARL